MKRLPVNEGALLDHVRKLLRDRGWLGYHTRDSRGSDPGFPDVVALRGPRLVVAELKSEGRKPTMAQTEWLRGFTSAGVLEVYLWRPEDIPEINRVLW
jgi:hypothetical protein